MNKKKKNEIVFTKQSIKDAEPIFLAGYKEAFLGYAERYGQSPPRVAVYDTKKIIKILRKFLPCDTDAEAYECFNFNILGAGLGEGTPIFVTRMTEKEFIDELNDGGEI